MQKFCDIQNTVLIHIQNWTFDMCNICLWRHVQELQTFKNGPLFLVHRVWLLTHGMSDVLCLTMKNELMKRNWTTRSWNSASAATAGWVTRDDRVLMDQRQRDDSFSSLHTAQHHHQCMMLLYAFLDMTTSGFWPLCSLLGPIMHQRTKFQQNHSMPGWVTDDSTNFPPPVSEFRRVASFQNVSDLNVPGLENWGQNLTLFDLL